MGNPRAGSSILPLPPTNRRVGHMPYAPVCKGVQAFPYCAGGESLIRCSVTRCGMENWLSFTSRIILSSALNDTSASHNFPHLLFPSMLTSSPARPTVQLPTIPNCVFGSTMKKLPSGEKKAHNPIFSTLCESATTQPPNILGSGDTADAFPAKPLM